MEALIRRFVAFSVKRHKLIVFLSIVLIAIGVSLSSSLTIDSSMNGLLPEDNTVIKASEAIEEEFGGQDSVILVVKGDFEKTKTYMNRLEEEINKKELAQTILYKFDTNSKFWNSRALLIPTANFQMVEKELQDNNSAISKYITQPGYASMIELFQQRLPLFEGEEKREFTDKFVRFMLPKEKLIKEEIEELLSGLVYGPTGKESVSYRDGYMVSEDGNVFLMTIKPKLAMETYRADRDNFFAELDGIISDLSKESNFRDIEAGYAGNSFVKDYESDKLIVGSFTSTILITFIIIILFVILSFRRILIPFASGVVLILGLVLTSAFAAIVFKQLNMFSISFAALLLGMGIDFAIHIYSRYSEERAKGKNIETAMGDSLVNTGIGMLVGAITTAAAFLTFVFAEFKAFTQMGIICAVGIMLSLFAMVVFMPSMIIWMDRKREGKPFKDVEFSFMRPVGLFTERFRKPILLFAVLIAVVASINLPNVKINADLESLYPENLPSEKWTKVLKSNFEYDTNTIYSMANDIGQLRKWIDKLNDLPSVKKVESLADFIPEDPEYKLSVLAAIKEKGVLSAAQQNSEVHLTEDQLHSLSTDLANDLGKLLEDVNKNADTVLVNELIAFSDALNGPEGIQNFQTFVKSLEEKTSTVSSTAEVTAFTENDLPENILSSFKGITGKYLMDIIPEENSWDTIGNDINSVIPAQISGTQILTNELIKMISKDIVKITLLAMVVILFMLVITFRSFKDGLIGIVPVVMSVLAVAGLGNIFGVDINILNVMALPMILGIGVACGVHLVHRIKGKGVENIKDTILFTGKAIIMTTLTTMFGFGSFVFTNHPGLISLGMLVIIGLAACLIFSILIIPSIYLAFRKSH